MMTVEFTASKFKRQLKRLPQLIKKREERLYMYMMDEIEMSIKYGSNVTGAPGQPVQTGNLLNSWKRKGSARRRDYRLVSNLVYAPIIEDNFRGAQLRSPVGGFHSVKITFLNLRYIAAEQIDRVVAEIN